MKYDFTPNGLSLLFIWIITFFAWRLELDFTYKTLGATWYSFCLFIVLFFITPFVLWWLISRAVYEFYK